MGQVAAQHYNPGSDVAGSAERNQTEASPGIKSFETPECEASRMSARDRWTVPLKCSACGRVGEAHLSQEDGCSFMHDQSTTVDSVAEGFRVIASKDRRSVDFVCTKCGKSAKCS